MLVAGGEKDGHFSISSDGSSADGIANQLFFSNLSKSACQRRDISSAT